MAPLVASHLGVVPRPADETTTLFDDATCTQLTYDMVIVHFNKTCTPGPTPWLTACAVQDGRFKRISCNAMPTTYGQALDVFSTKDCAPASLTQTWYASICVMNLGVVASVCSGAQRCDGICLVNHTGRFAGLTNRTCIKMGHQGYLHPKCTLTIDLSEFFSEQFCSGDVARFVQGPNPSVCHAQSVCT